MLNYQKNKKQSQDFVVGGLGLKDLSLRNLEVRMEEKDRCLSH